MKKLAIRGLGLAWIWGMGINLISLQHGYAASGTHGQKSGWAVMFSEKYERKQDNGQAVVIGHIAQVCASQDGHHCTRGGKQTRTRHGEWKWFWTNGKLKAVRHFQLGQLHGVSKAWYPNGQLRWEEQYVGGKLEGERRVFFANGKPQAQENYKHGQLHGDFASWWWDGKPSAQGQYENGKQQGVWKTWYLTGHAKEQVTYNRGQQEGLFVQWWYVCRPSGCGSVKMLEGFYHKGEKKGRWLQGSFSSTGQFTSTFTSY